MRGGINKKIIYSELSYRIVNVLFNVYNNLGYGYSEKHYEKAIKIEFQEEGIKFVSQCPYKIKYKGEIIGRYFMDFMVENKIILEIKKGNYFSKNNFNQVNGYLTATGLKLGILANFTSSGVKFKRVLNIINK